MMQHHRNSRSLQARRWNIIKSTGHRYGIWYQARKRSEEELRKATGFRAVVDTMAGMILGARFMKSLKGGQRGRRQHV
jgi:hypothetical protein